MIACPLFDMHFHLAWVPNVPAFLEDCKACALGGLGVTISPDEYLELAHKMTQTSFAAWTPALGFHPWYAKHASEEAFVTYAQNTRAIGEIGLDFARTPQNQQPQAILQFERICQAIQPKSAISIHSVQAGEAICEVLTKTGRAADCTCIFHWFVDSGPAFLQARELGAYFSVNIRQLKTKRGAAYVKQIAPSHLLLETDLPKDQDRSITAGILREKLESTAELLGSTCELQSQALLSSL